MTNQIDGNSSLPKIISYFENKYPVEAWCVKGIYIWPFIRIKLYVTLLSKSLGDNILNPNLTDWENKKHSKKTNKLVLPLQIVIAFFRYHLFLKRLKSKPLIFVGSHDHRVKENGLWFNRFFDSMVKTHRLENEVYMFEYLKVQQKTFNERFVVALEKELKNYRLAYAVKKRIRFNKQTTIKLSRYPDFLNELQTTLHLDKNQLGFEELQLLAWVNKLLFLKHFFVQTFKKIKPEKVIFAGYYGWDNLYAAIYAANLMKIKTIDYQHGPQTNHMVFANWNKHPKNNYKLMPSEYWNWDDESKKNVEAWAKNCQGITAKIAGQSYLAYSKNRASRKHNKEVIFYSLQGFDLKEMIPKVIMESMVSLPYHWVFRLHPRSKIEAQDVLKIFNEAKVSEEKFAVQDSKHEPILGVLSSAVVHITSFSGCVIEATLMGIPSIVIHPEGKNMFNSYIERGEVFYLDAKTERFHSKLNKYIKGFSKKNYNIESLKVINPLSF